MKRIWFVAGALLAATALSAQTGDLLDARSVLRSAEQPQAVGAPKALSKYAVLLADIRKYRVDSHSLSGDAAAKGWFALLDRAMETGTIEWGGDFDSFDDVTQQMVGVKSVLASLPPPKVWPSLRAEATQRVRKDPQSIELLATRLLTEALDNDVSAMKATVVQIEAATSGADPARRLNVLYAVSMARTLVAKIYGTADDIVAAFEATLEQSAELPSPPIVEVPDLVGMVGEARAAELLRKAVASPARLQLRGGDDTRKLARRVALQESAHLRLPQWSFVDSLDAAALYEEFQQRFGSDSAPAGGYDPFRNDADIYYLLSTIVSEQQAKAEKALISITRSGVLHLPRSAVEALQRAEQNEALYKFLHGMLATRPDLLAWDVYIEQASYTGHSEQALALIRELLARKDLNAHVRGELLRRESEALLAANRIDAAVTQMRRQIAGRPAANDKALLQSTQTAVRLAEIGLLLRRNDLVTEGLRYAEAATAFDTEAFGYDRPGLIQRMLRTYRRTGRPVQAQALAVRELSRPSEVNPQFEELGLPMPDAPKRLALIELVGLYAAADRHADVLAVLGDSRQWSARDLSELTDEKDSLGVPVGMSAARALAATGNGEAATKILRGLLDRLPGYDPAYELFTRLAGDRAIPELESLYSRDQFEERPLIWKAHVLSERGMFAEAEQVSRQAIAIDPSDGEQGSMDRLRAYAVLAGILEGKGDRQNAALYRSAIEAIRLSENADEFHAVGMYDRAFGLYRDALARFSDAYCIQSRLAIQLTRQGRHGEAASHYRRAYELMPESFGRVESHCFGCESVFRDADAQGIAEEVFTQAIRRDSLKPQTRYLLGYLREEQRRYKEALQEFRSAVALDDQYLNAWKHLHELGERTYVESGELDIARLKLLRLDPRQRHVRYDLRTVGNLASLWKEADGVAATKASEVGAVYRLTASAEKYDEAIGKLPPAMRMQVEEFASLGDESRAVTNPDPQSILARHAIVGLAGNLMAATSE
jgi:tetratricopeptide (TPR) repeat protein